MDWHAIGLITSVVAALAGWFTAIFMFCQNRLMCQSISVDALLRLDAAFNSADMRSIRRKAAAFLLCRRDKQQLPDHTQNEGKTALNNLLNFFEGISFLANRKKMLDPEAIWCFFFNSIDHYYCAAKEYIKQEQEKDETLWRELVNLHEQLVKIERRYRPKYKPPEDEQIRQFLEDEKNLNI